MSRLDFARLSQRYDDIAGSRPPRGSQVVGCVCGYVHKRPTWGHISAYHCDEVGFMRKDIGWSFVDLTRIGSRNEIWKGRCIEPVLNFQICVKKYAAWFLAGSRGHRPL